MIAHGFAGSRQLMLPFAVTLARRGYVAVLFDFLGHGRNPTPLGGSLTEETGATVRLLAETRVVLELARSLPAADGRVALLGHSMASDIVVRAAMADPTVQATVGVSMFAPEVTATSPRNLVAIVGALEPAALLDEARRIVAMAAPDPRPDVTYGSFADGTARRYALSPGVEHIGVLYGGSGLAEAAAWLDAAFDRRSGSWVDARGPWLGLLFLAIAALVALGASLLPRLAPPPPSPALPWRRFLAIAALPALLTPVLLRPLPTGLLPMLVGDYLVLHFALYGLLTAAGLRLARRAATTPPGPAPGPGLGRLALCTGLAVLLFVPTFALPLDAFVLAYLPIPVRLPILLALLAGTILYFTADARLVHATRRPRLAYALTKLAFLVSLALAVALDLERLFFLIIAVPVILVLFLVYGVLTAVLDARVRHPLPAALASALAFAWAIAVTFPLVAR